MIREVFADVLLGLAVAVVLGSALGVLVMRDVYQKLHFLTPAALVAPVPRRQPLGAGERQHLLAHHVAALGRKLAVGHRDDVVPAPRRVEAEHQLAVLAGPEGVLELVAVAPLLQRRHDRL